MGRRNQKTKGCSSDAKQVMNTSDVGSHSSPLRSMQPLGSSSGVGECSNVLDIAIMKEQHLVRELELETALRQAREEIESMKLKCENSREQGYECSNARQQSNEGNRLGYDTNDLASGVVRINDCASPGRNQDQNWSQKIDSSPYPVASGSVASLPRVELSCFDGNLAEYWTFMKQFEYYVEAQTSDPGQRFLQLLNYCKGRAHEAIKECVMLPPVLAYERARKILRDLFGQPFHIARSMIEGLLSDARRVSNSSEALSRLAIKMQNCGIALSQMNYESDLNALHTLEAIVKGLPSNLQTLWAEQADSISLMGREPSFAELTDFVGQRSRIARSRFGQLADRNQAAPLTSRPCEQNRMHAARQDVRAMALATSSTSKVESFSCRLCGARHRLSCCPEFLNLSVPERWKAAKRLGACFSCLGNSHMVSACTNNAFCQEAGCHARHHRLLHRTLEENDKPEPTTSCNAISSTKKFVRLGIVPIKVDTPRGVIETLAFLDSGSDTTLVRESFLKKFGVHGEPSTLTVSTIGGARGMKCSRVNLKLMSLDEEEVIIVDEVSDLPIMPVQSFRSEAERWPYLRDINFHDVKDKEVNILLGCDVPEAHWVLEQRISGRKRPFAVRSLLGWILCGPLTDSIKGQASINYLSGTSLVEQLKFMYDREFGDTSQTGKTMSVEDRVALTLVSSRQRLVDGHFEVPLPWKPGHGLLLSNKILAEKRLSYLRRRMLRDQNLCEKYKAIFQRHLDRGFLERLPNEGTESWRDRAWYLPHHPVFNPKKPEKVRVVFDGASKFQGMSLNDRLLQGPDLTSSLVSVLLKFRMEPIAVAADIEEMFLQVCVPEADRDALRILWWPEHNLNEEPITYRLTVHPFGAISSPFCANFALQETIKRFGSSFPSCRNRDLTAYFYVDDFLASFADTETAIECATQLTAVLAKGGFHLTKWISNDRKVMAGLPNCERASKLIDIVSQELPVERTLGLSWDSESDEFVISFSIPDKPLTRRGVLAAISSLYDPMGFVSPWVLPGKVLLQDLCKRQLGWDDPLEPEDANNWIAWSRMMSGLGEMRIARCIKPATGVGGCAELHLFCDASEVGYGAVAYLCGSSGTGERSSSLVFSKARVAPIKAVSIPRLELAAATLAVEIWVKIRTSLMIDFEKVLFWTDSMIVLYYINNTSTRFCTFVANRLSHIHDASTPQQWRYVRSEENPADAVSRGIRDCIPTDQWLRGPTFLRSCPESWPSPIIQNKQPEGVELKRGNVCLVHIMEMNPLAPLFLRYSSWTKLLKAVAWLTRFKRFWMVMKSRHCKETLKIGFIGLDEIRNAEIDVLRLVQLDSFPVELQRVSNTASGGRRSRGDHITKLNPTIINGLMCVGGRLSNSSLDAGAKHPVILPQRTHITNLIIRHYHILEGHAGVAHVLGAIRKRFWILRGPTAVKRFIGRCGFCRRQNATIGRQLMAPLPSVRVQPGWHAFFHVGLDYFGPIEVKRGRSMERRYGCILTCLQSRAVHIEVAHSLSTDSFLMLLIRFIGRRGSPQSIYSDNGANFVRANIELRSWIQGWDKNKIACKLLERGIQWHFNPPYASHRGGVWERLIRSIRRALTAVCNEQVLNDETLLTALAEVERILNNRPIVSQACGDSDNLAITPNDLLLLRSNSGLWTETSITKLCNARWKQANYLASVFWRRWTREYLPVLQARQKWLQVGRNFSVGDVVLVVTESLRREFWPVGIVNKCYVDSDGLVRTVDVKMANSVVRRDVRRICLLEGASGEGPARPSGQPVLEDDQIISSGQ